MYECMYRALRNNCSKAEMEGEGIWITNTFNTVMTVAMGQNLKEKETVFECIGRMVVLVLLSLLSLPGLRSFGVP